MLVTRKTIAGLASSEVGFLHSIGPCGLPSFQCGVAEALSNPKIST